MPLVGHSQKLQLSTNSDSALFYYYQGWEQVLDYGHFTNSEKAYRAMYKHDPGFLVGASLLARITPDPQERQQILQDVERKASRVTGDKGLLLDPFLNLTRLYIYRETNLTEKVITYAPKTITQGENTLSVIAAKYPDDIYYKAEYIEFLHANRGPKKALDSLINLFPNPPPFMLGYSAQLMAELKRFDEALKITKELEDMMSGNQVPYVQMVYAKIYKETGEYDLALKHIEEALTLDPGHILALRMKKDLTAD